MLPNAVSSLNAHTCQAIFTLISDGVVILDDQMRIQNLNVAAHQLLGFKGTSPVGQLLGDFMPALACKLKDPADQIWYGEVDAKHLEVQSTVLYDKAKNHAGYVLLLHDRTEYKTNEQALTDAQQIAQIASATGSSILSNMNHEIRTPLTSIVGYASILAHEVGPAQRDIAHRIEVASRRLLKTMNAIFDLARLDAGSVEMNFEIVDVNGVVREVVDAGQALAQTKGLKLSAKPASVSAWVRIDADNMKRILQHLIENAIKFTEAGEIVVSVIVKKEIVIQCTDTGIGIPDAYMPYLFEPFSQGSRGIGKAFEGNGLGLSVIQKLVTHMQGTISAKSKLSKGSVFTLTFPYCDPRNL